MTMTISLSGDACSRSQRRNCQTNIYQFMFLHIPLLCLRILLPLRSRSFLHRFHNICTRCPVERWSTLSLSLSLYFNPFNYELHQSIAFLSFTVAIRSSLYRATKSSTSSVYSFRKRRCLFIVADFILFHLVTMVLDR